MKIIDQKISSNFLLDTSGFPFPEVINQGFISRMMAEFKFSLQSTIQDQNSRIVAIQFLGGVFSNSETVQFGIEKLQIEQRKVSLTMTGDSEVSKKLYEKIVSIMKQESPTSSESFGDPIVIADESLFIAKLNFDAKNMCSEKINALCSSIVEKSPVMKSLPVFISLKISGTIDFIAQDEEIIKKRISLSKKEFQFSIAPGYGWEDSIFMSKAPLPSAEHLAILQQLEQ